MDQAQKKICMRLTDPPTGAGAARPRTYRMVRRNHPPMVRGQDRASFPGEGREIASGTHHARYGVVQGDMQPLSYADRLSHRYFPAWGELCHLPTLPKLRSVNNDTIKRVKRLRILHKSAYSCGSDWFHDSSPNCVETTNDLHTFVSSLYCAISGWLYFSRMICTFGLISMWSDCIWLLRAANISV